ncbi:MAG TPA: hypothetical protein VHL57_02825 [Flavobacteriales bacterium]|jgi:hypothetical protein|nr:hypothetical protein [Flavobacteriales bacterium]
MWKKVLAALCVPVVLALTLSIPYSLRKTLARMSSGDDASYQGGYIFGAFVGMAGVVLAIFFLSRWIIRTFKGARQEQRP